MNHTVRCPGEGVSLWRRCLSSVGAIHREASNGARGDEPVLPEGESGKHIPASSAVCVNMHKNPRFEKDKRILKSVSGLGKH